MPFLNHQGDSLSGQDFRNSGYTQALSVSVLASSLFSIYMSQHFSIYFGAEKVCNSLFILLRVASLNCLPLVEWAKLCWGQNCKKVKVYPWHHSHLPHPCPHSWPCNWFLLLVPNGVVFPHLLSGIKCSVNSFILKDS